jgi:release factor glutamine methyltransferase
MPDKTWSVAELLQTTAEYLAKKDSSCPRLESELLLGMVLGLKRVQLYINFERPVEEKELAAFRELVRRRAKHEPVAYIMGAKEFYKLSFKVSPDTLIPRPETEHLVDEALRLAKAMESQSIRVADVGCGSGAIALSLAANLPPAQVEATDISPGALAVARENAKELGLEDRVSFWEGDLARPLENSEPFQLILSNLPYVPSPDMASLPPDVAQYEPKTALDGGPDGLSLFRRLLPQAQKLLCPEGRILLEIHPPALEEVGNIAKEAGFFPLPPVLDYSKKARVFVAKLQ